MMKHEQKRSAAFILFAFIALVATSAIRRTDARFVPALGRVFFGIDPARQTLVFFVHLILAAMWWASILRRVTHRNMRVFLVSAHFIMLFWLIVRLLQASVFYNDIYVSRFSGYLAAIPASLLPLLGLYASLGLGSSRFFGSIITYT